MVKRKVWRMLGSLLLAGLVLAGCAKEKEDLQIDAGPDLTLEQLELFFYAGTGANENTFNFRVGDSLREKFPNWTITQVTGNLNDLVTAGEKIDIYFHTIGNFESQIFPRGLDYDMTELITKHQVDLSIIEPTILEAVTKNTDGVYYGLPVYSEALVLFYNKEIFDRFGVDYPRDGMFWDEMIELNRQLTRVDDGKQYFGFAQSNIHTMRMNPLYVSTADVDSNTPLINKNETWRKTFDVLFMQPMQVPGYLDGVRSRGSLPTLSMFTVDRAIGMFAYMAGSMIIQNQAALEGMDWDMVALPTLREQAGIGSQAYPAYFGITSLSEKPDAAMLAIKYMVSEEFQLASARKGITPVVYNDAVKQAYGADSPFGHANLHAMFYNQLASIPPKPLYDATLITTYNNHLTQYLLGTTDLNTALRVAEEEAVKKIEDFLNR